MAKAEIELTLKSDLSNLKEISGKVPNLKPESAKKVSEGLEAAEKAFNSKDWSTFRVQINKVIEILSKAIISTGKVSAELENALKEQQEIQKRINEETSKRTITASKYQDKGVGKMYAAEATKFYHQSDEYKAGKIVDTKGIKIGRREDAVTAYEALQKAMAEMGKNWQNLNQATIDKANSILAAAGKTDISIKDISSGRALNRVFKKEGEQEATDKASIAALDEKIKALEVEAGEKQTKIEQLTPASEAAAKGLEEVYQELVKLGNATNKDITTAKSDERYTKAEESGGGAALEPKEIDATTKALDKQSNSLGKAFKQFSLYAIALRTIKKAVNEAARTIKDLDKYLTTQAMVTGKTRKETYALLKTYQDMAAQLGATTKEVADVATQFMRQGKSTSDALKLTTAAISAAKVAGIGVTESVNYLTTALNGFQLSAEQAMKVSDKFASIAAQSATSYEEIATALSKVAAQASMAGMSIDYTTALLAKGIETTREAPETIGTALKTIIARMRELTDYGVTLEDGMNINNVEKQLAYVGIALRTETGELRSTEDVLDELGKKWTELSSNQQAAVAKALAGTRQQSRLIAMMTDYERVTELQEIAQRSAGATAAQAATYMEGMEAALNRVNTAWEKVVTTVTDSEVIINIIDLASNLLNGIADFLNNDIALFSTLASIAFVILTHFIAKLETQKAINRAALQKEKIDRNDLIIEKEKQRAQLKTYIDQLKEYKTKLKITKLNREDYLIKHGMAPEVAHQVAALENEAAVEAEIARAEGERAALQTEINGLQVEQLGTEILMKENASGIAGIFGKFAGLLTPFVSVLSIINTLQQAHNAQLVRESSLLTKNTQKANANAAAKSKGMFAGIVSAFSATPATIAIGIALAIGLVTALGFGIAAAASAFSASGKSIGNQFNELSNQVYKLTEQVNALKKITTEYDKIDNKIIKTAKDQEDLNKLLEEAADKLSESDKDTYKQLVTQEQKIKFLRDAQNKAEEEALQKRIEQNNLLKRHPELLIGNSSDALAAQSALIANNNDAIYRYIDTLDNVNDGVEAFTQSVVENMDAVAAYRYTTEGGRKELEKFIDTINKLTTTIDGEQVAFAEIINSEDYSLRERIDAYNKLYASIQQLGDPGLLKSLEQTYSQWGQLDAVFSRSNALEFMDTFGVTIDELNDFSASLQKLGYTVESSAAKLNELFDSMAVGGNIEEAIGKVFGLTKDSSDYLKVLEAYQKAVGTTILDMGQKLQSFKSQVNSIYETATKWSSMTDSEKTDFATQNQDLFRNSNLYEAFETGNYNAIEAALKENEYLQKNLQLRKQELQIQLDIEKAKKGTDQYNEFNINYLQEQLGLLEDIDNIFKADLKLRLDQENAQLDIYKEYLQKQQDALVESLDKRKEAYQKYFDAINAEKEDEKYEEQASTLIANLSKLSSSTNADSVKQSKELEKQLEELEKERLETLRQRAQEAVMSGIEDEVSQINDKFDKLLENNQMLLQMMREDLMNPADFASKIIGSEIEGQTVLGAENFIQNEFMPAFASLLPSDVQNQVTVQENGNNLTLNIAGQTIELGEASQKDLADTIFKALRQLGINI